MITSVKINNLKKICDYIWLKRIFTYDLCNIHTHKMQQIKKEATIIVINNSLQSISQQIDIKKFYAKIS